MEWTPKQFGFFSRKRDNVMLLRLSNLICGLMITMGLVLQPSSASGGFVTINSGYDLLLTLAASFDFQGAGGLGVTPFVGVPLGTYNFGAGSVNTGATDTILHRLDPVINLADGASQTVNLEMVALSLRTKNQIDWSGFGGSANEYVKTVNLINTGGSTMTITNSVADLVNESGTFDSNLNFSIQLEGVTSGVLSPTISLALIQTGGTWEQIPPFENVLIDGVNKNGFYTCVADHGPAKHVTVDVNCVPEPTSSFAIGLACMAAGGGFARRRRLKKQRSSCAVLT
ncbi:MAG: PEP-CTERM sorting domain-containing protein [Planctomycetota bacterium]|nr:PEP-CTERM sorting domain-containing protein [Planctomycetota bacterium]